MPVGDVYQLSIDATLHDQQVRQVHHYRQDSADPPTIVGQTLIDAWNEFVKPTYQAFASEDLNFTIGSARRVHPNPSQTIFANLGGVGDVNEPSSAANTVGVSSYYARGNPSWIIGRTFISGIVKTAIHAGLMDAATRLLVQAFATRLLEQLTDSTHNTNWQKVMWNSTFATVLDILDSQVRTQIRKLRSRTVGTGD